MKTIFSLSLSLLLAVGAFAQSGTKAEASTWVADVSHSNVRFAVTHMVVSEMEGSFKVFSASVKSEAADFDGAQIDFTIDAATINTDNTDRDNHLRGADFFDVANNPQLVFKSTSFKKTGGNKYKLMGTLTMHGVTKPISFAVTYGGTVKDPWGNTKAGFKAVGKLNRYDYGLKWNTAIEAGGIAVSEEVNLTVNIELQKK